MKYTLLDIMPERVKDAHSGNIIRRKNERIN